MAILQIGVSEPLDLSVSQKQGVEFVNRSLELFVRPQVKEQAVLQELVNKPSDDQEIVPASVEQPRRAEPEQQQIMEQPVIVESVPAPVEPVAVAVEVPADKLIDNEPPVVDANVAEPTVPLTEVADPKEISVAASEKRFATTLNGKSKNTSQLEPEQSINFLKAKPRYALNPLTYPESALRRRQQGTVQLEVLVLADGGVGEVKLLTSSGFKTLDRAAQKAVNYWKFEPALSFGRAVESRAVVPVDFVLNKN